MWIDSHAHFCDERYLSDFKLYLNKMKEAQVRRVLIITLSEVEYRQALVLKQQYPFLDIAYGIHPEAVAEISEADWITLEKIVQEKKIIAIGEIGLDYYWVKDNKELQQEVFKRQLKLAKQFELPVLIHMREATADTYQILKEVKLERGGVMHCYGGSVEMAREFIKLGFLISTAGVITFKNAKTIKEVILDIPLDKILIETDSPFLTPEPFRGKQNEPSYVAYVGQAVAKLKNLPIDIVSRQLLINYQNLFKIKI